MTAPEDVYTHGHAEPVLRSHRWRTAENSAGYLLPRLHEDARVLDVGCGPGTITLDLARVVTAGSVVGLDRDAGVLREAREAARQADVRNVELRVGDVYALDHDTDTFDVVHAHQVLQHLSDPVAALREMARVCKPDGLVAVRDSDYAAFTWWPHVPELDEWLRLYRGVARRNGAEPDAGRRLKSWARAAGLDVVSSTAGVWCFSSAEDVAWWGGLWAERVVGSGMADQAVTGGLATREDLERLAQGWRRWASSADAWFSVLHGELLCSPWQHEGVDTPSAVQRMIEATNAGDHAAFVAAFTEDAYLEDWGRQFHGHEGVGSWDESDNIGKNSHFAARGTRQDGNTYVVTLEVTGDGFNGTSDIAFETEGDRIRSMVIKPG